MSTLAPGEAAPGLPIWASSGGDFPAGNIVVAADGSITEAFGVSSGAQLSFESVGGGGTFETLSVKPVFTFESPIQSTAMLSITNEVLNFASLALGGLQLYGPNVGPTDGSGCSVSADGSGNLLVNGAPLTAGPLIQAQHVSTVAGTTVVNLATPYTGIYTVQVSYIGAGPYTVIPSAGLLNSGDFTIYSDSGVTVAWLAIGDTQ